MDMCPTKILKKKAFLKMVKVATTPNPPLNPPIPGKNWGLNVFRCRFYLRDNTSNTSKLVVTIKQRLHIYKYVSLTQIKD